jgi:hypothetical protein
MAMAVRNASSAGAVFAQTSEDRHQLVAGQTGCNGIRDEPTPGGAGSLDHARFARNATPFE